MPEQDQSSDRDELISSDPEENAVLVERLRLVAGSLTAEFRDLSRTDAERLMFAAAQEVLSEASVAQFVPTFAERRARRLLRAGQPIPRPGPDVPGPRSSPPGPPGDRGSAPSWPDAFYTSEAKRLLEKARHLRATLPREWPDGRA